MATGGDRSADLERLLAQQVDEVQAWEPTFQIAWEGPVPFALEMMAIKRKPNYGSGPHAVTS